MSNSQATGKMRKRALSERAKQTRERVFDAAETIFATRGFDGATIRDIAAAAGEPVGTIHHHGGGKEALFNTVVARRAETLSQARLEALEATWASKPMDLRSVLSAFIRPLFDLAEEDPRWQNYAKLVAFVSVDDRWTEIAAQHFDPTAHKFMEELQSHLPKLSRQRIAEGFVFTVSAMLALVTSERRISALGGGTSHTASVDHLVAFCAAGFGD